MKYLVMECRKSYAILLDEEGRFLRAANLRYEVGQTVENPVLLREKKTEKRRTARWISGITAAAACFLLFFGFGYYYPNYMEIYSSVFLTINPEIQMDLNRQGDVVELTGMNEDGEQLLRGYDGDGKDKVTVADELIDRAVEMGFLSEGGQVSFSIDAPDEVLFQEYGTELRKGVEEHLSGRLSVVIEITGSGGSVQDSPPVSSSSQAVSGDTQAGDSRYGDSRYGDSGSSDSQYGDSSYASSPGESAGSSGAGGDSARAAAVQPSAGGGGADNAESGSYGGSDYGDSGYEAPDGGSNYGSGDSGDSGYGSGAYGDSGYEDDDD